MATRFYKLDARKNPVQCSANEWANHRGPFQRVALDIVGQFRVSTVFLGMDHGDGQGAPELFETMVFDSDGDHDGAFIARYSTWAEAEAGHRETVRQLKEQER